MSLRLPTNDVELAERVALQVGAPAHDTAYWEAVVAGGTWPEPDHHTNIDREPVEDWRDR